MIAFTNGRIFTGEDLLDDHAVIVNKDLIIDLVPTIKVPASAEIIDLESSYMAPAFADLQIYGGDDLLFGEYPSVESLKATYAYSLRGGASHILPTISTNSYDKIFQAIDAIAAYWESNLPGVVGLHVEGPYINPVKKGAHVEAFIRRPKIEEVIALAEKGKGIIRMITLAPEVCTNEIIEYLHQQEIIVSAGHSNASYEEANDAFSKGIKTATHLFNAMSPLQHRAPGMVGAIFNDKAARCSVIADGHHLDFSALSIAKKIMQERLFYITDAVTANNGIYPHQFQDDKYIVADGTLSGSSLTMLKAVRNGVVYAGISLEESLRMASAYPWKVLGLNHKYGSIKKNYMAELVIFNDAFEMKGMYTQAALTRF